MVDKLFIQNTSTNTVLVLNRTTSQFLLDDNSPDWGTIESADNTFPLLSSNIGVGVIRTSINNPRTVSISGWVINDSFGSIESKKEFLNTFCNPFDDLKITCGDYTIYGHFSSSVVYPSSDKYNNDCICKFLMTITCPFPLFTKELNDSQDQSELSKEFVFPLVLPAQNEFVFGYRTRSDVILANNSGSVSTGFVMELRTASSIQGITFTLGTNQIKLKSDFTLVPGKMVRINTISGSRGIWYGNEDSELSSAFSILDLENTNWIQLPVGLSSINISCDSGSVTALDVQLYFKTLFYAMEEQ